MKSPQKNFPFYCGFCSCLGRKEEDDIIRVCVCVKVVGGIRSTQTTREEEHR
jgi:hypothetical protein